ncbi:MAG: ribonuclease D, partial [Pseudomonadota bacterium]
IFYHSCGAIPVGLFDTQVAAMVCGFGDQVGYETLVRRLAGASIDKSSRFTDWSRRPLSPKQINYALSDVTHLRTIYERLAEQLTERDRWHWMEEEMAILTNPETFELRPEEAWGRLKLKNVKPRGIGVLVEVAAWREREAQRRDVPRGRVLKDDAIYDLAHQQPSSAAELEAMRGIARGFGASAPAKSLLQAIETGKARAPESLPRPQANKPPPPGTDAIVDLLRVLLKFKAEEHEVASRVIANAADLERLALNDEADIPALQGWRRELFGEDALALKSGRLALRLDHEAKGGPVLRLIEVTPNAD